MRGREDGTHLDSSDFLTRSRSSPLPLYELTPNAANAEEPHSLALQSPNLLLCTSEVAVVEGQVGLAERSLVRKEEVGEERGGLLGVAELGERERGGKGLQKEVNQLWWSAGGIPRQLWLLSVDRAKPELPGRREAGLTRHETQPW